MTYNINENYKYLKTLVKTCQITCESQNALYHQHKLRILQNSRKNTLKSTYLKSMDQGPWQGRADRSFDQKCKLQMDYFGGYWIRGDVWCRYLCRACSEVLGADVASTIGFNFGAHKFEKPRSTWARAVDRQPGSPYERLVETVRTRTLHVDNSCVRGTWHVGETLEQ